MSRSYRHFPCCKSTPSAKRGKIYANRKYRRSSDKMYEYIPKGNHHKRFVESWDICDYRFKHSFSVYVMKCRRFNHNEPTDSEEDYQNWLKYYIRK